MGKNYEKITFPNGFRVIFERDPERKSCSMGVWVLSGSCYESAELSGISHFTEHMLFKGSLRRTSLEIAQQSESLGADINAYTDREYSCFYTRCLAEGAGEAFDILADMITSPRLDADELALEKKVVKDEIAMYESSPADLCADAFYSFAYPASPLGMNILGSRDCVDSFTPDSVRGHMARCFTPERMVASFSGNFCREELLELCEKYFGSLERGAGAPQLLTAEFKGGAHTVKTHSEHNQIIIGFESVPLCDERRFALRLLSVMLGGSSSSQLFRKVREERGLVYSIDSYDVQYQNSGVLAVSLGASRATEREAVERAAQIIRTFPDTAAEEELERAKSSCLAGMIMSLESPSARAAIYAEQELLLGKTVPPCERQQKMAGVRMPEIKELAREFLNIDRACVCAVGKTAGIKFYNKVVSG